jgi:hypothetical protein
MKSIVFTIVLSLCSFAVADSKDRVVNTFAVDVVHVSGGTFIWEELGGGENSYTWVSVGTEGVFQVSFEVTGAIDIEFLGIDGVEIYATNGGVVPTLSVGAVTFTEGYYVIRADNTVESIIVFETPGASPFRSVELLPLWTSINTVNSDVHWEIRDGQIVYEFTGGGDGSAMYGELSNSTGTDPSEQEGYWYGPVTAMLMLFPPETETGVVTVGDSATIEAGDTILNSHSDDPFRVVFIFGEEPVDPLPEDLDGDGIVGLSDLLALIAAWGSTAP